MATIFFECTLATDHRGIFWWKPSVCGGEIDTVIRGSPCHGCFVKLTWLTAFNTMLSFSCCPCSDCVTSGTSSFLPVSFSHSLCNTWPSYMSSSSCCTMMRCSASSSLIQSISILCSLTTSGSFIDCGSITARCSCSPIVCDKRITNSSTLSLSCSLLLTQCIILGGYVKLIGRTGWVDRVFTLLLNFLNCVWEWESNISTKM